MQLKETLNRLHRSPTEKMLGGVCGGIGETTGTPAWVWRAAFLFTVWVFGSGILLYVILWMVMPDYDPTQR